MNRFIRQCRRGNVTRALLSIMPKRSQPVANLMRGMIFILAVLLLSHGSSHAQRAGGPFERLAGHWVGSGTIDLSSGAREPIRCRAAYDVLAERRNLQINIRCASDSYNFNLFSNAVLAGRAVSGTWSESTHGVAGTISGTAEGDHIHVSGREPVLHRQFDLGHARWPAIGFDQNSRPECRYQGRDNRPAPSPLGCQGTARARSIQPATGSIAARRYGVRSW